MKTYKLSCPNGHDTIVEDGKIQVMWLTLSFKDEVPPDGTAVRFWLRGDAICKTLAEIEELKEDKVKPCKHQYVLRDYIGQPNGRCCTCGNIVD